MDGNTKNEYLKYLQKEVDLKNEERKEISDISRNRKKIKMVKSEIEQFDWRLNYLTKIKDN